MLLREKEKRLKAMANIELDTTKTQNIASKFNDKINIYNNSSSKGCGFVDKCPQPLYFNKFCVKNTVDKSVTN